MEYETAKYEIKTSLKLCFFATRCLGLSFEKPKNKMIQIAKNILYFTSVSFIVIHVFSDAVFIVKTFQESPRIENIVRLLHTQGYGVLSAIKAFVLWYKKNILQKLLVELSVIWPVSPLDVETENIKNKNLKTLRIVHVWYFAITLAGVWFYNLTPICVYFYHRIRGEESWMGTIWSAWYPFDITKPIAHLLVYLFETMMGQICVWVTLSTDLLYSGIASHIVLLLRLLQRRLKSLTVFNTPEVEYHKEIIECIKFHQRLIRYCKDIGEAFSFVNLINIVFSSINICCVSFSILLLEPLVAISNKLFLISVLIQVGMLCWYGQVIIYENSNIATAVYDSEWHKMTPRCRRDLLFMIQRTQKPIGFTAMNFTYISLVTYTAIMTRAYSYFALLYTVYTEN